MTNASAGPLQHLVQFTGGDFFLGIILAEAYAITSKKSSCPKAREKACIIALCPPRRQGSFYLSKK
jgi:hypothetical protein